MYTYHIYIYIYTYYKTTNNNTNMCKTHMCKRSQSRCFSGGGDPLASLPSEAPRRACRRHRLLRQRKT